MSGLHTGCLALLALASAIAGFAALSLAMERHWEQLHGRGAELPVRMRRRLRHAGSFALFASLLACIALRGSGQGWVAWAGMLTLAAIVLVLTLTFAARSIVRLGSGAALLSLAALAGTLALKAF